jgi:exopolysaccharide biosynthesis protein
LAAINASFFNPDGSPLGLVVTGGSRRGSINRASSLGAGFFVESSSGELRLVRREHFQGGREAVQAGPFLVENGRAVGGLSDAGSSARSFIATDGRGGWVMARTGPGSLAALGQALQNAELGGVKIRSALNLDGGRSSEIWVSDQVAGGPRFTRPFWNSSVRNYLVLRKR